MKKVVAVTACPTGIAHTYMAAENLQMAAKEMGVDIKVETQGSIGAENQLTEEDIKAADAVIIAAATKVDKSRFAGKPVLEVPVEDAIKDAKGLIEKALKMEKPKDYVEKVEEIHKERSAQRTGAYKHLMTGVSYMIPFVVAGGILIALSFFWGYKAFEVEGTLPWALMKIGGGSAFALMVPILSGYIAFSIADRPGLVPGMVGGMLAVSTGAGFLGGIISGFLAGYTIVYLKRLIKLPKTLEGLMPILILPVLSTLIVGLLMIYVIGSPMKAIMTSLTDWLTGMSSTNAVIFGAILGLMMAFDMGGPVNKTAYTFATGLLASNVFAPMAAVMAAGMTPPLGLALATALFKNRFTKEEIEAGKAAWVLGASFITEGAIPFAAADPFRVIPSIMVGSAVTGALSMLFHIELRAPHGGIFVIPIAVSNPLLYIGVIAVGTVVTALMVALLKKKVE
ncbi:PTS system D-fructose-specific IIB component (F1P-forming), Frc family /PTS system D-fructose-specific IIC component (F1P-forming), Frc family [Thermoanaerobacter thermohydrosulfuricus]|jgi:PTS system fructose-specific IIC component|uniref:PTS system, fructose subfamily, IIC subunit n=3 Tax=Thermoanaerobacter TaxID=1754 RepID=B0KBE7_THEP3|nr:MULTISPECIES: fructose-specific PTS transporter subunit EIIC [Thermoanaerobacter]ABY93826.1 PTS system, fructose subfamily, IIC subunit [Thermoanaerobacter pseudethanolicus ATCC 33223]ADV78787.1 PTS system, fructose subfamily, IIC subunit [Thermoanaerobacter brockii subsp. finnii Ako-1]SDF89174.1 PTS system D-fructose-specific IIB component (F1P-forming), Frc family /PTS system D-fructose-specific IIC component (F1P-forming), Frc family [Thermoanaerobacter thermohydrosulfuricus]HBW59508.1 PT